LKQSTLPLAQSSGEIGWLGLHCDRIACLRRGLLQWGRRNFAPFVWRRGQSDFHSLVVEILLQRTRAEQVSPVFLAFRERFPDASSLASSSEPKIRRVIEPLGLHWRARQLLLLGVMLQDQYRGRIPPSYEDLVALPGVGQYAASAYLSLHKNVFSPIADANIVRFYGRALGLITDCETRRKKWFLDVARVMTPRRSLRDYNYALLDFTRAICRTKPRCDQCPVRGRCDHYSRFDE
jgi:A/G-specific adenine glycosylase